MTHGGWQGFDEAGPGPPRSSPRQMPALACQTHWQSAAVRAPFAPREPRPPGHCPRRPEPWGRSPRAGGPRPALGKVAQAAEVGGQPGGDRRRRGPGGGGQTVSAPAAIPFPCQRALLTTPVPPSPPAQGRAPAPGGAPWGTPVRWVGERKRETEQAVLPAAARSPPAPGPARVRAGDPRSHRDSRPGTGATAHAGPGKAPRRGPDSAPAAASRSARPLPGTAAGGGAGGRGDAAWRERSPSPSPPGTDPRPPPAPAVRGRPLSYRGVSARAAASPLRAPRQPGHRCTLARVPARRPGRRWPLVRGGRGSRQVPPPRLGRCAAVAADGYGNERLCLARSV
ncbi:uncharacterized protein LOC142439843 [Tenrec ecaudatus]|uniref:uncharacterized protein LOC142439843 n=1 Tax=Tenrec ecaudatus TaxID=94439 RepID=UPI003F5A558C